jgi:iron complex transport system ATP-binding protein
VLLQIKELSKHGYSVIMSTHNPEHALQFAGKVLALRDGEVYALGPAAEVLDAALIRALYGVDPLAG